jgi:hypothetical protein
MPRESLELKQASLPELLVAKARQPRGLIERELAIGLPVEKHVQDY